MTRRVVVRALVGRDRAVGVRVGLGAVYPVPGGPGPVELGLALAGQGLVPAGRVGGLVRVLVGRLRGAVGLPAGGPVGLGVPVVRRTGMVRRRIGVGLPGLGGMTRRGGSRSVGRWPVTGARTAAGTVAMSVALGAGLVRAVG
ncbi:hypothetical protein GCM10009630_57390 [Kribbella jejuensis]